MKIETYHEAYAETERIIGIQTENKEVHVGTMTEVKDTDTNPGRREVTRKAEGRETSRKTESKAEKTPEELELLQELRRQKQREKKRLQRARKRELAKKMLACQDNVNHTNHSIQTTSLLSEENSRVAQILRLSDLQK